MENKSKYYKRYRFNDNTSYDAEIGKDGVTEQDMKNLRNVDKHEYKTNKKQKKLDVISLETLVGQNESGGNIDISIIIETSDTYEALYNAIEKLQPQQQELIDAIYFNGISARQYAVKTGISHTTVNKRLEKILDTIKNILKND